MKKQLTNIIASQILKKQASSGSLDISEIRDDNHPGKAILMFVEIEASDRDNEKIITAMKKELSDQFFNAPAQTDEYAFENALAKANLQVKDILLAKPKNWLQRIHIAAVALCDDEIHIAPIGNVHAFLVHNQKVSDVLATESKSAPNPVKIFTNIVSGKLSSGNAIVLTNEAVLDYLSEERIRKCAHENEPKEALEKLCELLARAPENKQFGLVAVKRTFQTQEYENLQDKTILKHKTQKKESAPLLDEKEYEKILPQSAYQELDQPIAQQKRAQKYLEYLKKLTPYAQAVMSFILSLLLKLLEKTQKLIARTGPMLSRVGKTILITAQNQKARAYHIAKIKSAISAIASKISNIQNLRPNKKTISGAGIFLLIIVFAISIATRARDNQTEETSTNTQEIIFTIENKVNEAEAAMIYGNKAGALTLIIETEALLSKAEKEYPNNTENYRAIRDMIEKIKMRAEKKRAIENLKPIISIIPEPIRSKETGIASLGSAFIYYDGAQERIAKIDLENDLLLSLPLENQGIESFNIALPLSDNTLAALKQDAVLIINAGEETISKQVFSFNPSSAAPFASYGKNLYSFDINKNQIIIYSRAGAGFTAAQNWLTQEYELSTIIDISVDGFIYLLDTQGNVHTFLNGKFRSRLTWPASDAPSDNARLYTREEIDTFYVLDPKNSRIVRISKQGELIEQLISDEFSKATNMLTDAEEKNILLLADDKIFFFPLAE